MDKVIDWVLNLIILLGVLVVLYKYVLRPLVDRKKPKTKKQDEPKKVLQETEAPLFFAKSEEPKKEVKEPIQEAVGEKGISLRLMSIKDIVKLFPGIYMIPLVWAISFLFIFLVWLWQGPSMHTLGPEYVEIGFLGYALATVAIEFAFIMVLLEFPGIWAHMKNKGFIKDFQQITPFQRWLILLGSLYLVLYTVVNSMQLI